MCVELCIAWSHWNWQIVICICYRHSGRLKLGKCTLWNAEFQKGVFCGFSHAEISCGIKIAKNALVVELCQLNRCTVLQST